MSSGYNPQHIGPVAPPNIVSNVTTIQHRNPSSPRVDGLREGFEATFGGYLPPDWTLDAECTQPGTDPAIFFPGRGGKASDQAALAMCAVCPVQEECLTDAIEYESGEKAADDVRPEVHGVRGGMVAKDRRRLIQQRKPAEQEQTREAVVADYVAGQLTVEEITAKHGVHSSSITRWAKAAGHPIRATGGGHKGRAAKARQAEGIAS